MRQTEASTVTTRMIGNPVDARAPRPWAAALAILLLVSTPSLQALAAATSFVEPTGWSVGDPHSSHQQWIADWQDPFENSGTLPNISSAQPSISSPSTMGVVSPGYPASSGGYYSLTGNYAIYANLVNHGGESGTGGPYPPASGTRVFIQTAATLNPDVNLGVLIDSLQVTAPNGAALAGGDNASKLQATELFVGDVETSFGIVPQQELLFEFWLPGYTGDFKLDANVNVHSSFQHLRVDFRVEGPAAIDPDFSGDDAVDGADFLVWQRDLEGLGGADALAAWKDAMTNPGATPAAASVPEPSALLLLSAGMAALTAQRMIRIRRLAKGDSPLE